MRALDVIQGKSGVTLFPSDRRVPIAKGIRNLAE